MTPLTPSNNDATTPLPAKKTIPQHLTNTLYAAVMAPATVLYYTAQIPLSVSGRVWSYVTPTTRKITAAPVEPNEELEELLLWVNGLADLYLRTTTQLENLEELKINFRLLREIPESIKSLKKLKRLDLSNNDLEIFPSALEELPQLEILKLSKNSIEELPDGIQKLVNLKELYIDNNCIKKISPNIITLKMLIKLDLSSNALETLPTPIGELTTLKELILDDNKLKTLPAVFGYRHQLTLLSLNQNQFSYLPYHLVMLSSDCTVAAKENLFSEEGIQETEGFFGSVHDRKCGRGPNLVIRT